MNAALVERFSMRRLETSAYHPQSEGAVERGNAVVLEMLHYCTTDRHRWHESLPAVELAVRTSVNLDTGLTPFFMLYGRDARLPDSFIEPEDALQTLQQSGTNSELYTEQLLQRILKVKQLVLEAQAARDVEYAKRNSGLRRYEYIVGDKVMSYLPKAGKLQCKYDGPYVITEDVHGAGVTFKLERTDSRGKSVVKIRHASLLKPYVSSATLSNGQAQWSDQDSEPELEETEEEEETGPTSGSSQSDTSKDTKTDGLMNTQRAQNDSQPGASDTLEGSQRKQAKSTKPKGLERFPIGTAVYKYFFNPASGTDQLFSGRVIGYDARRRWFRIEWSDGDAEEMTVTEVKKHLQHPGDQ